MTQIPTPEPSSARRRLGVPETSSPQTGGGGFLGRPPAEVSRLNAQHQPRPAPTIIYKLAEPDEPADPFEVFEEPAEPEAKKGLRRRLPEPLLWVIDITVWVVAAIVLSTLLRLFIFQMFLVPSDSMELTLIKNDRIAALKMPQFQRGDIVVFVDPGHWLAEPTVKVGPVHRFFETIGLLASTDKQYLVKRAIGLPGDRVQCCTASGHLMVNGVELDESLYLKEPDRPSSSIIFDIVVPAGRIFVMGDNRYNSADSRYHLCQPTEAGLGMNAFVPEENVVGPVRAVVMPLGRTGHRALPTSVFADVPAPSGPAPNVPSISVTGGFTQTCQS